MKKPIEYGNITLMDEVETEEADKLIDKMTHKYAWLVVVPLIVLVVVAALMFGVGTRNGLKMSISIGVTVLFVVILVVCVAEYSSLLSPYYKLKKIAELNDRIRHEEKIRVRERKRLEQLEAESTPQIKRSDIENTYVKMDIKE